LILTLSQDTISYMAKYQRSDLLEMVKSSWFPPHVMQYVFDVFRPETGVFLHVAKLCMSHPDPEVRAMATAEILPLTGVSRLDRLLWS
jgi:hypothetical protein